jgi:hypothetical protein
MNFGLKSCMGENTLMIGTDYGLGGRAHSQIPSGSRFLLRSASRSAN